MKGIVNMKKQKNEKLFIILCVVVLVVACAYMLIGGKESVPAVEENTFDVTVSYKHDGEQKTVTEKYGCYYIGDGQWEGYFESSGGSQCAYIEEENGDVWNIEVDAEAGYFMGDENYAGVYDEGFPTPTITYFDVETGEETSGLTVLKEHDVRILGCEYPEPIENEYSDGGIAIDGPGSIVLTVLALVILALSLIMIRKREDVIYSDTDKISTVFNYVVGIIGVPAIALLCYEWDMLEDGSLAMTLVHLLAPATVIGVCASIILRRKGQAKAGMMVQFIVPVIFLAAILLGAFVGMLPHSLALPIGIIAGVLIAWFSKGNPAAEPSSLDRICKAINIFLVPVYALASLIPMFLGAITYATPDAGGLQEAMAMIISLVIAGAPIYCGITLGLSVSFRKKGKSKAAFIIQFAGFVFIILTIGISLLTDNISWISTTIN